MIHMCFSWNVKDTRTIACIREEGGSGVEALVQVTFFLVDGLPKRVRGQQPPKPLPPPTIEAHLPGAGRGGKLISRRSGPLESWNPAVLFKSYPKIPSPAGDNYHW